jgi:hypothetical protein
MSVFAAANWTDPFQISFFFRMGAVLDVNHIDVVTVSPSTRYLYPGPTCRIRQIELYNIDVRTEKVWELE